MNSPQVPSVPGHEVSVELSKKPSSRDLIQALAEAATKIKELSEKAYTDSLTGLANRAVLDENLPNLVKIAHETDEPLALIIADIDGQKRVNDQPGGEGHLAGDKLIKEVGNKFAETARPTDIVGRLGGDEFFKILPGFKPLPNQTEEQLVAEFNDRHTQAFNKVASELGIPDELKVGVSFGLAILQSGETAEDLYKRADAIAAQNKVARIQALEAQGITFQDSRRLAS